MERKKKGLMSLRCLVGLFFSVHIVAIYACIPSRCGEITNITHPFRLRDDPPNCGDRRYELSCENDVALLSLYNGTYRVLGINYNNFTIRVVDHGIEEGNCASLPHSFLSVRNFTNDSDPYAATIYSLRRDMYETTFKYVVYLNCSDPVRDDADYVDTSPCVNWESKGGKGSTSGHMYAMIGDLPAKKLKPPCHVKMAATLISSWPSLIPKNQKQVSYAHIHAVLSYGFEVSWWLKACADHSCPDNYTCSFDADTPSPYCEYEYECPTAMGIIDDNTCRHLSKARIFAEDYLYGIYKGLRQIRGEDTYKHYSYYDFSLTQFAIDLGVATGRVFLPYIAARFLFGIIFLLALLIYTCRRRYLSIYEDIEDFLQLHNLIPIRYSYKELKAMTKGFNNKLGEGGFGSVFKGKLISGPHVAIKMLGTSKSNGQDFISEVATIGRIHHFNVVRLVGFCVERAKRALVYEFMPNGSLDKYIFSKDGNVPLSYEKVYEIALGVARGIAYLHHGCDMQILHFDIKPHNILLDDNFIPKISDFGLARLYPVDDSIVTLTAARGTIGYMAPELFYKNIGGVSYKADVYSFGMLLMEMASRRRNLNTHAEHSSQLYFPLWIYDQFNEDNDIELKDLTMEEKELAKKMFIIALWCIQLKPVDRPSMNKVVEMLEEDDVESLEMPPKPSLYPDETIAGYNTHDSGESVSSSDSILSLENLEGVSNFRE